MRKDENTWVLPLTSRRLERCCIDLAFSLEFGGTPRTTLRMEGAFPLDSEGVSKILSPAKPESLGHALMLMHQVVEEAVAFKRRTLVPAFLQWHATSGLVEQPV